MGNISYVFLLLALVAEVAGTIGGFGSSVFFVPMANLYFDFQSVLGIAAVFHLSSDIFLFKQSLNLRLIVSIGVPSIVFVLLGGYLAKYINPALLEIFLAVFFGFSVFFLLRNPILFAPLLQIHS